MGGARCREMGGASLRYGRPPKGVTHALGGVRGTRRRPLNDLTISRCAWRVSNGSGIITGVVRESDRLRVGRRPENARPRLGARPAGVPPARLARTGRADTGRSVDADGVS